MSTSRVVIVTGASQGVVAETVKAFRAQGHRVVATARSIAPAVEADAGIRANAVSPGIIKSPMHPAKSLAMLAGMHPVGRMGEMSDIVNAILYHDSAPFVTGEILHVDGGQSAGQ
ncbi:NAD(P)-dependent dehydrogenase (short-subunit alcohol dehydrogenase family) [Paraburkholderia youngii]|uniref:NAD(P)-dependent dehydrogenase (Short-subunit alcohol dehydrogenase family) n=1 Tax=Paraburkholderia youngii TaxID=2782701 RepID=A0A7W8L8H9_9BURK|nr:SDR family oxidoreductase [Paraburkholderia youngii]MBB5402357.1 NAD(P)-dependent dehydrogenase (short-subunit alcohol dehydrogenase family) [Paraburkholderia youngii]